MALVLRLSLIVGYRLLGSDRAPGWPRSFAPTGLCWNYPLALRAETFAVVLNLLPTVCLDGRVRPLPGVVAEAAQSPKVKQCNVQLE